MATPAIRVEGLGKRYRLVHGQERARYRTLRESLTELVKSPFKRKGSVEEFWALNDVSFEVQAGEVVGIIGRNGAGKSTLLKILSRITKPTTGRVEINGRVGSLLEVGTGFHPELTGRENIYLNGSILGMSRKEIDRKFDEIVAFAEVEKFLDTPVKRYSSGMYVRLAFAVAAHLEPEILIVDEVLAVGDAGFQKKCTRRMGEVSREGRTVLIVSHDIPMVSKLSSRMVWMNDGRVHRAGHPDDIIGSYYSFSREALEASAEVELSSHPNRRVKSARVLEHLRVLDHFGTLTSSISAGESVTFEVTFDRSAVAFAYSIGINICDISGVPIGQIGTASHTGLSLADATSNVVTCRIDSLPLYPGEYSIGVWVGDSEDCVDEVPDAIKLTVASIDYFRTGKLPDRRGGPLLLNGSWSEGLAAESGNRAKRAIPRP